MSNLLGKKERMSKSTCLTTVVLERLWDGLALIFLVGIVFIWVGYSQSSILEETSTANSSIKSVTCIFTVLYLIIFLLLVLWKYCSKMVLRILTRLYTA